MPWGRMSSPRYCDKSLSTPWHGRKRRRTRTGAFPLARPYFRRCREYPRTRSSQGSNTPRGQRPGKLPGEGDDVPREQLPARLRRAWSTGSVRARPTVHRAGPHVIAARVELNVHGGHAGRDIGACGVERVEVGLDCGAPVVPPWQHLPARRDCSARCGAASEIQRHSVSERFLDSIIQQTRSMRGTTGQLSTRVRPLTPTSSMGSPWHRARR
jgi:hypothetical protein